MYQQIMYYCKTNAKIIRDKSDYMYMKSNLLRVARWPVFSNTSSHKWQEIEMKSETSHM